MTPSIEKAASTAANPKTTNPKDNIISSIKPLKFDPYMTRGLTFQPCGNSRVRFSDLNTLSERNRPLIISVPFFMLTLGLQLVCRVLGGLCPAGFLECRFANLTPDAPFLFSDEKGVYITLGGSL